MYPKYPTSLNIDSLLWKKAKIEAINRGITITELLEYALETELNRTDNKTDQNITNELRPTIPTVKINSSSGDTMNTLKIGPAYEGSFKHLRNNIESAVSGTTYTTT